MDEERVLCGVDIGGTKLDVGLVTAGGVLLDSVTMYDHVDKEPDDIMQAIAAAAKSLLAKNGLPSGRLAAVGVGTAGHLRFKEGILIAMSNLHGFRGYPIRSRLQQLFGVRVCVDNDANAQAFGELTYGAGRGYSHLVFMTISTQIGAGIILDNRLYRGVTGTAGEIGHTIVAPDSDFVCPCGNTGCLISVASGVALPATARKKVEAGVPSTLIGGQAFDYTKITGELVKRGLDAGDRLCIEIVRDFASYIGIACYNLFQIFNPQAIVLGGGLLSWGDVFLDGIRTAFTTLAKEMMFDNVEVVQAKVGKHSGVIGAASLALGEA